MGFAVQLCVLSYPGWSLTDVEPIPDYVIQYIAKQINANSNSFSLYAQRDPTKHEHMEEIRQVYGYQNFSVSTYFVTDKSPEKTIRYPDGSYTKVKLEILDEEIDSQYQTLASNGFFKTIRATGTGVFGTAQYSAKIWIDTHLGNDYIDSVYNPYIHAIMGTHSEDTLSITRKYEIRSQAISAKFQLKYNFTNTLGISSKTVYLKVHAGDHINDQFGIWVDYSEGSGNYK